MAETDRMNVGERGKYLHKMRILYWQATREKERSRLLDEMEVVTGLHRKSLLRLIRRPGAQTASQATRQDIRIGSG